jgi:hypothetical protein
MRLEIEENPWDETSCQLANGESYFQSLFATTSKGNTNSSRHNDSHPVEPIRLHRSSHHYGEECQCHTIHDVHSESKVSCTPFAVDSGVDFREISHTCNWALEVDQKSIVKNLYELFSSCSCDILTDLRDSGNAETMINNVHDDRNDNVMKSAVGNGQCFGDVRAWNEDGSATYLQEFHITPLHHDDSIFPFDEK